MQRERVCVYSEYSTCKLLSRCFTEALPEKALTPNSILKPALHITSFVIMYCRSGIPWGALGGSKITYRSAGGIPLPAGDMCHVSLLRNGLLFVHIGTADNMCVHWRVWKYSNALLTRHVCVCASHSGLTVSETFLPG